MTEKLTPDEIKEKEAEEKAATEKAAEEKAATEKAASEAAASKDDDLASKDVSKYSMSEMIEYVDKLKDENAKRRIANRKLSDQIEKVTKLIESKEAELSDATKTLSQIEQDKKAKANAEKSEVERLKGDLGELQKELAGLKTEVSTRDSLIAQKDMELQKQQREIMVDRILFTKGHEFSSEYERNGFMASLLKVNSDGEFELNDEEVIMEVQTFIKKHKRMPSETPGAGPPNRSGETPLNDEIKALTTKKVLTPEDHKRLDELLELSSQAAEFDERRQ